MHDFSHTGPSSPFSNLVPSLNESSILRMVICVEHLSVVRKTFRFRYLSWIFQYFDVQIVALNPIDTVIYQCIAF